MAGVTYQVAIGDKDDKFGGDLARMMNTSSQLIGPSVGELWNSLWIKIGVGADYRLLEKFFLRAELLYGVKPPNKYERDTAKYWERNIKGMSNGLTLSVAVGYKLKSFTL
jgi:hypothetical protein